MVNHHETKDKVNREKNFPQQGQDHGYATLNELKIVKV